MDGYDHEAGFDAFCTGKIFSVLIAMCGQKIKFPAGNLVDSIADWYVPKVNNDDSDTEGDCQPKQWEDQDAQVSNSESEGEILNPSPKHEDPFTAWDSPTMRSLANYINVNGTVEGSFCLCL